MLVFYQLDFSLVLAARHKRVREQCTRRGVRKSSTQTATGAKLARDWDMAPGVDAHCIHTLYFSQIRSSAGRAV